ncbi:hypothetical protein HMI54_008432 [Coelomomyces lativittatus]|nr:hypothetical protein HMI54_008432 [Coelomomyces lativittatus]KAJ1503106.1 hypothetical protein HMI55_002606 [Coelomomyces lativittatus]KAJ1508042.1 hypothetical protein HMI56_007492 [Coelomomyces lativittatus]
MHPPNYISSISFSWTTLATLVVSVAITLFQSNSTDPLTSLTASMKNAPSDLVKWVSQLLKASQLSKSVVFLALLYLSKLHQVVPMNYFSPQSSITVSLVLASKFLDDHTYSNKAWAHLSGMDCAMLIRLEMQMLDMLNYNLNVSTIEYSQWLDQLQHALMHPASSSPILTSSPSMATPTWDPTSSIMMVPPLSICPPPSFTWTHLPRLYPITDVSTKVPPSFQGIPYYHLLPLPTPSFTWLVPSYS